MTPKKRFAFFGAFMVGLTASVLALFPQTTGIAPAAKGLGDLAREAAANIPDECPASHAPCADAGRGAVRPLDGGVRGICECP